MADEVFYLGYDNTNDFQLLSNDVALDMTSVTQIDAYIGTTLVSSTNQALDVIRWSQPGFAAGEIRCQFGEVVVTAPQSYTLYFVIYDPTVPDGIVFGPMTIDALTVP